MRRTFTAAWIALTLMACVAVGRTASAFPGACGGCCFGGPPPTLSQQLHEAHGAYLARIVSKAEFVVKDEDGEEYTNQITTFELIETLKPGLADVVPRMHVTLDYDHDGSPGDLAVLFGVVTLPEDDPEFFQEDEDLTVDISDDRASKPLFAGANSIPMTNWTATESLTWAGSEYIKHLPSDELETDNALPSERLAYFLPFLEHADSVVADDAFEELERAEFVDLIPLADRLPRAQLRKWVAVAEDEGLFRRRLYGILLGLCGNTDDAELLRKLALAPPADDDDALFQHIGMEGVMTGYLLMTGESGLDVLTREVLADHAWDAEAANRVLLAIQFLAQDSPQTIPAARLHAAVRQALDRQDTAGSAIYYLRQLSDWDAQDRVIALLDMCDYEDSGIRDAIVEYLNASAGQISDPARRETAAQAQATLDDLKRRDPKLVEEALQWSTISY